MGYTKPPEYNDEGIRTVSVSTYTIKQNCDLGMFVGEKIKDMSVNDSGQLVIEIEEYDG
jgi:hypothetical protein